MRIKIGYVIGLVFVGALVAAVPGVDGYYYQKNYTALLASLGENAPVKVEIVDYRLGWLSSDVQLSLDLNPPDKKPDPALLVTINQHITHGPLLKNPITDSWTIAQALLHSNVHIDKKVEANLIGENNLNGLAQIDSIASFNDHYQNQVSTPLFSVKISETGKFTWQGVTGNVDVNFLNDKLKHIKSDLTLGMVEVQDATGNLSIQAMKAFGERDCQQAQLCTGTSEFSMPNLTAIINNTSVKLVGSDVKTQYGVNANNAYSGNAEFSINKLTMPDYTVGPASIKFAVNDVNTASVSKMIEISRSASAVSSEDSQAQRLVLLAEYNKELPHLITAHTVINQDTTIDTSYGNFKSVAKFYWPANTPLPTNTQGLTKMNFHVDVQAAATLIQRIVKVIDAQQGITDSDTFATKAEPAQAAAVPATAPTVVAAPVAPVVPQLSPFELLANSTKALLNIYVTSHKISPDVVKALIDLQKQHLSPVIYNQSVDRIILIQRLPKDVLKQVAQQLKDQYVANYKDDAEEMEAVPQPEAVAVKTPAGSSSLTQALAPALASSQAPVSTDGRLKQQIDALIKQGYIKIDKDNYIVSIVYDGSAMKVNDISIPLPNSSSTPGQ